jgi:hypothetical protein
MNSFIVLAILILIFSGISYLLYEMLIKYFGTSTASFFVYYFFIPILVLTFAIISALLFIKEINKY